ncbi:MAG: isoprenylcysteine carboxylmethyltransferase family protein [Bacteroidales bacterium]|nr:isoprenylcysteine carboxylmethyltransferase family protein [Bacteroidales bacterium]
MRLKNRSLLIIRALLLYLLSLFLAGLLIFLPAGSLKFWNGWLFMGVLFISMFCVLIYLLAKDPDLLAKRLKTKEKEKTQKIYLILSIIFLLFTFIMPGLDFRFNWSDVPLSVVLISTLIMMSGYLMFFIVMKQNTYASRVIEIQDEQRLIDTGLYSFVRHPMYLGATILYGFAPLVLGSFYALIPMVFFPVLLIIRIKNEEKVLVNGLKGYDEYMKKVKYRLFPFIW